MSRDRPASATLVPLLGFILGMLTVALAGGVAAHLLGRSTAATWRVAAAALAWSPGPAAWFVGRAMRVDHRSLFGLRASRKRFYLVALLLPLGVASVVYGACWSSGLATFNSRWAQLLVATGAGHGPAGLAVVAGVVGTIGEELGWRGFLVPLLARRCSLPVVAWGSWLGWFAYHVPIMLWTDYHGSTPWPVQFACFGAMLFSLNALLAWIRLRSGSLWPAVVLHAAHHVLIENVFDPLTVPGAQSAFVTGEFGAGLAATYLPVAFLFLIHGVRQGLAPTDTRG